jgi:hypothetical protein
LQRLLAPFDLQALEAAFGLEGGEDRDEPEPPPRVNLL